MAIINKNFRTLAAGYLFPEIARRAKAYQEAHAGIALHRLGIGNTTEALPPAILEGLHAQVTRLGNGETYTGYGDEQGNTELRDALVEYYKSLKVTLRADEFFVSDGAKADAANIQSLFDPSSIVAIQDPAYPVYVDSNVVAGRSGQFNTNKGHYENFVYLPGTEENNFFPDPPQEKVDLIYLCSPNNPTGAVATHQQLQAFVDYAIKHKAVIIFDAAYAEYISDSNLPRTIYEIPGARQCAIELNSFSKFAGFTGVRLGWTIVPHELMAEEALPGELHKMWFRRQCTFFNGASNIAQAGGVAALSETGLAQSRAIIAYYMENARIIREGLRSVGLSVFGGDNAPYLWVKTPHGLSSWDFFDQLLHQCQVIATPGSGFGPTGEHYIRVSAFGHRENIERAVASIKNNLVVEALS
ncbi:MAG: LL-diaminopimelate aminotransferase [Sphaerochaetaceae bacterium]|jgi:LL-diaminopimelate aminotransferase|nr:LL-diaminopimelate aminotransferase [Sphaerochaetaceae bacterium]MDY0371656.1 LL-diaminopimelate aminotransferase [Sphaerochaetaceae bacterium]